MNVLVVEDDDGIAEMLAFTLRRYQHEMRRVSYGGEALADASTDLVLLDLGLPDMDGFEVLRRLRATGSAVPVVVMTARREPGLRARASAAGADGFVSKPFAIAELLDAIDDASMRAEGRFTPGASPMGESTGVYPRSLEPDPCGGRDRHATYPDVA
jgi:DNA-binding response OmpR family regulator